MPVFSLDTEPDAAVFKQLMEECFRVSDTFSLTPPRDEEADMTWVDMFQLLSPYLVGTIKTHHWFSNYVYPWCREGMRVYIFRSCKESQSILMDNYHKLFSHNYGELQDLCFFKDKVMFLGTLSHECLCVFYSLYRIEKTKVFPPTEVKTMIPNICRWKKWHDGAFMSEWINYENMIMLTE